MSRTEWLVIGLLLLSWGGAAAEVADSSAGGFTVKHSVTIQAPPAEVFARLLRVGEWWDPVHTFSGDAHNLSIEPKPMGCFCEKLPPQGSVRHMEVILVEPGKRLLMSGGLGPLQQMGVVGTMTIQLAPAGTGTSLQLSYAVSGYSPQGMASWAAPVDAMLGQQFVRLKNYVERGSSTSGQPSTR